MVERHLGPVEAETRMHAQLKTPKKLSQVKADTDVEKWHTRFYVTTAAEADSC